LSDREFSIEESLEEVRGDRLPVVPTGLFVL
jgi:hypothetical protein